MPDARTQQGGLLPAGPSASDTVIVNGRRLVRTRDDFRMVLAVGVPLFHFRSDDRMAKAHAVVSLVEQGWASQVEAAQAFGLSTRSVRRFV